MRRLSKEEFARRGDELIANKVRPNLSPKDAEKYVAIDVESGEYELDHDEMRAVNRLRRRIVDPQVWLSKLDTGYLYRLGGLAKLDEEITSEVLRLFGREGWDDPSMDVYNDLDLRRDVRIGDTTPR